MATDKKISELPVLSSVSASDVSVLVHAGADYQYSFATLLEFLNANTNAGSNISFGTTLPQNSSGKNGDVFINTTAGSFAQKQSGTWAVKYTFPISSGAADGTVLYGTGLPGTGIGSNNDTYINTATGIFYHKAAGAWTQVFSMQTGPQGPKGDKGDTGATGVNGKTILNGPTNPSNSSTGTNGDFYLNTNTLTLFGPKAAGVWGTGASIVGVAGEPGETGPAGEPGAPGDPGPGVATGGTTGQVLSKVSNSDFDTQWVDVAGGGGFDLIQAVINAPVYESEEAAAEGGIQPFTLYKTSTGELRYKLNALVLDGYAYHRSISISNINTGKSITNCAVKLTLNSTNFTFNHAKDGGGDIRIIDTSNNAVLPIFIESYDHNAQLAVVWTKTSISLGATKELAIFYGNAAATTISSYDSVFSKRAIDSTVVALYHFDEGTGNVSADATGAGSNAILSGHTWVNDLNFQTGSAVNLSGSNSSILIPGLLDDFGICGTLSFSIKTPNFVHGQRIFTKGKSLIPGSGLDVYVNGNQLGFQISRDGQTANNAGGPTPMTVNVRHRITITWDLFYIYLYLDGLYQSRIANYNLVCDMPATFGAFNTSNVLSNFFAGTIDEIVVLNEMLSANEVKADAGFYTNIPSNQQDKFTINEPTLLMAGNLTGLEYGVKEATLFKDDNDIKLYYTGNQDDGHERVFLATTPNMQTPFTRNGVPIIGLGAGGAPSNRLAMGSCVVKYEGIYYAFATNGYGNTGDGKVYGYTSTDGINFTDLGVILNTGDVSGILVHGNTWVIPELINGKFYMYAEGRTNTDNWTAFLYQSTSIASGYTLVQKLPTLRPSGVDRNGSIAGGLCVRYVNNVFYGYFHYGDSSTPSQLGYAESADGINWTVKQAPFLGVIKKPFDETDQIGDACVSEIDGKTYLVCEFVENTSPTKNDLYLWEFDGTFKQLNSGGISVSVGAEVS